MKLHLHYREKVSPRSLEWMPMFSTRDGHLLKNIIIGLRKKYKGQYRFKVTREGVSNERFTQGNH